MWQGGGYVNGPFLVLMKVRAADSAPSHCYLNLAAWWVRRIADLLHPDVLTAMPDRCFHPPSPTEHPSSSNAATYASRLSLGFAFAVGIARTHLGIPKLTPKRPGDAAVERKDHNRFSRPALHGEVAFSPVGTLPEVRKKPSPAGPQASPASS